MSVLKLVERRRRRRWRVNWAQLGVFLVSVSVGIMLGASAVVFLDRQEGFPGGELLAIPVCLGWIAYIFWLVYMDLKKLAGRDFS